MNICRTKQQLKLAVREAKKQQQSIGFVPTMGYLHEGHASLLREAKANNDVVVLSIFVNPMQFGPNEDLDRYPRSEERDIALAASCGVDIVFLPTMEEMYKTKPLTTIKVEEVTNRLCGASRPGHFDGVGLIVSKLFNIVQPDRAYFGMKDAQQVAVIEQMIQDLDMNVDIVPCPIIREPDGLALSSRNVYLSALHRAEAATLNQSLNKLHHKLRADGNMSADECIAFIKDEILTNTTGEIDYVDVLHYPSLTVINRQAPLSKCAENQRFIVAVAVKFGTTRLIDNALFQVSEVIERV